ncbi:solute carrier family 35 member G1-like [Tetranychus urticae]|uniref:EamA domain-containing protein n=1 Tax=Tetranychus urticae TaxID=32264 RepID=T1JPU4_TETUR|nr:solute carrier family 35 member G1-like [Tetranychus urticae]XP_015793325.1 solute carrier family 35 member G1-like [Tetranychus urticae]
MEKSSNLMLSRPEDPEVASLGQITVDVGYEILPKRIRAIPGIGLILALLSGVFFATGSLTVKLIQSVSGIEIAVIRSLITLIAFSIVVILCKHDLKSIPSERVPLALRCLTGCIGLILTYVSIKLIPLGDSQSIIFSSPVFVNFFAYLFLGEPCGLVQYVSIIFAMIGVLLISKPSFLFPDFDTDQNDAYASTRTTGTLTALGACCGAASVFICIRKLQVTPSSVVIFWHSAVTVILGTILLIIRDLLVWPQGIQDYVLLLVCGVTGIAGQALMTLSLKLEKAGPVSLARTMDIVMAFVYQITILKEAVAWTSLFGAFILVFGVIIVALNKWYTSDPKSFKSVFLCGCAGDHKKTPDNLVNLASIPTITISANN